MQARRALGRRLVARLLAAAAIDLALTPGSARARPTPPERWLRTRIDERARALRRGALPQPAWQAELAAEVAALDPAEVVAALALAPGLAALAARRPRPRALELDHLEDAAGSAAAIPGVRHRLFTFSKGQAIVPHGHDNLVSAFIVVDGEVRARHFERIADVGAHLLIRPSIDRVLRRGEHTSISDLHDNVHWLSAESGEALVYNVSVDAGASARWPGRRAGRIYVDPAGTRLSDGTIEARRTTRHALEERYDRG